MLQHRAKSFIIAFKNDYENMNTNRGHQRRHCFIKMFELKSIMSTVIEADTDEKISSLHELNAGKRHPLHRD